MKKQLIGCLILSSVLLLAGCGEKNTDPYNWTDEEYIEKFLSYEQVIGYLPLSSGNVGITQNGVNVLNSNAPSSVRLRTSYFDFPGYKEQVEVAQDIIITWEGFDTNYWTIKYGSDGYATYTPIFDVISEALTVEAVATIECGTCVKDVSYTFKVNV